MKFDSRDGDGSGSGDIKQWCWLQVSVSLACVFGLIQRSGVGVWLL